MLPVLVALATAVGLLLVSWRLPWLSLTRFEERLVGRPGLLSAVSAAGRLARLAGTGAAPPRGLPVGSRAPDFSVRDANGSRVTLTSLLRAGSPTMLVFGDSGCQPCVALMPTVLRWQHELRDRLTIALITSGSPEEWVAADATQNDERVLAQDNREVADAYEADVTPSAVLVSADGRIASRLAVGELLIRALVDSSAARTNH
jgi:hypothetical protein